MNPIVQIYRGPLEIQALAGAWQTLQHHPNSDYEHFMLVCRLRSEVVAPIALGFWVDGTCRAIMAGRLERLLLRPLIGYAKFPGVTATGLNFIQEGILGKFDSRMATAAIEFLSGMMVRREIDTVIFQMLPEEMSSLSEMLRQQVTGFCGALRPNWKVHRVMTLKNEPAFLLQQMHPKNRRKVRKWERSLADAFPGGVHWKWCAHILDVPELCLKLEAVARTTYQRRLGVGFTDNHETRERLRLLSQRGQLRVLLLEINGMPKAFWKGTVYKGTFHSLTTGYAPDASVFRIGTLSFLRMVDELVREGVRRLDFGLGDAHYKERFADRHWREATVQLFAPTCRGRFLHVYLGLFSWLDHETRRLLSRLGAVDRIKKSWRARMRR